MSITLHGIKTTIIGITGILIVAVPLEEQATKVLQGAPFLTTLVNNWLHPRDLIVKRKAEDARERAREAAAAARALSASYPADGVARILLDVKKLKLVDNKGTLSQESATAKYWGAVDSTGHRSGVGHLENKADDGMYDGQFSDGTMTGLGRSSMGGSRYEGQFKHGRLDGPGCVEDSASRICGAYKEGLATGTIEETLYSSDGVPTQRSLYVEPHRYTVTLFLSDVENAPPGSRYEGEIKEGIRNGYGVAYFPDGSRYEGQWVDRWQQGFGVKINPSGVIEQLGVWDHGVLSSE
jgi:hypothetical protein